MLSWWIEQRRRGESIRGRLVDVVSDARPRGGGPGGRWRSALPTALAAAALAGVGGLAGHAIAAPSTISIAAAADSTGTASTSVPGRADDPAAQGGASQQSSEASAGGSSAAGSSAAGSSAAGDGAQQGSGPTLITEAPGDVQPSGQAGADSSSRGGASADAGSQSPAAPGGAGNSAANGEPTVIGPIIAGGTTIGPITVTRGPQGPEVVGEVPVKEGGDASGQDGAAGAGNGAAPTVTATPAAPSGSVAPGETGSSGEAGAATSGANADGGREGSGSGGAGGTGRAGAATSGAPSPPSESGAGSGAGGTGDNGAANGAQGAEEGAGQEDQGTDGQSAKNKDKNGEDGQNKEEKQDGAKEDGNGKDNAGKDNAGKDNAGKDNAGKDNAGKDNSGTESGDNADSGSNGATGTDCAPFTGAQGGQPSSTSTSSTGKDSASKDSATEDSAEKSSAGSGAEAEGDQSCAAGSGAADGSDELDPGDGAKSGAVGSATNALFSLAGVKGFDLGQGGNVEQGEVPKPVASPNVPGHQAVELAVPAGGKRSEVRPEEAAQKLEAGQKTFFGYSAFLSKGFPVDTDQFQVIWQLHDGETSTSPPVALEVQKGRLWLANVGELVKDLGPVKGGENVSVQMGIDFQGPGKGTVDLWRDGKQLLTGFQPPKGTMIDSFDYLKTGIYRSQDNNPPASSVFLNDLKVGKSLDEVGGLAGAPAPAASAASLPLAGGGALLGAVLPFGVRGWRRRRY